MKLFITKNSTDQMDSYVPVTNLRTLDLLVDDGEATEIFVDNFLSMFPYKDVPAILNKILSKLRLNGTIVIANPDIDFVCFKYAKNELDQKALNELLFNNGALASFWSIETICGLLTDNNIEIISKSFIHGTTAIIKGIRNA